MRCILIPVRTWNIVHGKITERNIIPEFEVFEIGMINNILNLEDKNKISKPMLFNIVLGHRGSTPATVDALIALRSMIPRDALWGITHFGRRNFDIIAAAVAMGASEVRIGFEDSYYLSTEEKRSIIICRSPNSLRSFRVWIKSRHTGNCAAHVIYSSPAAITTARTFQHDYDHCYSQNRTRRQRCGRGAGDYRRAHPVHTALWQPGLVMFTVGFAAGAGYWPGLRSYQFTFVDHRRFCCRHDLVYGSLIVWGGFNISINGSCSL